MDTTEQFEHSVLDVLPIQIAVLDKNGRIISVNQAWEEVRCAQGAESAIAGIGANYLDICRRVQGADAPFAQAALRGIEAVLAGTASFFSLEYPCYLPHTKQWFLMQVTPLHAADEGVVVFHLNITQRKETEEALAQERNLLRALIDSLPNYIFVKDTQGQYLLVNQTYAHFLGAASPTTVVGRRVFDFYPPDLAKKYHADDLAVLQSGQTLSNYEELATDHAGTPHFHLATKTPLRNQAGALIGLIGIAHDITERKQMEQELRTNENFIRQVLDTSPQLIFVKDWEGNFLLVNQAMADSFGMTKEALIHQNNAAVHARPEEVAQYAAVDRQVIEARQTVSQEESFTRPDGQISWYHTIKTPLLQANGVVNVLAIATDITEQRAMLEALRQSEARNRLLLEAIPDVIVRIDRDGRVMDAKAQSNFRAIYPPAALIGQNQSDILPPTIVEKFMHFNQLARTTGTLQVFEYEVLLDQEIYTREARIVPIDQNEVIAILRDITERKQAEAEKARLHTEVVQQRAQLRALTARLAEIQEDERKKITSELHDLVGQNLTALGLSLKLIQTQIPDELTVSDSIKEQLQDALTLVTQTTSAIRNMMAELRPPVLDDYGLLATLRWYSAQVSVRSHIKIDVVGEADQPRLPELVENVLFRIAQEAMTNIVKHAHATQAQVTLAITDEQVILEIKDNGQGFNPQALTATAEQSGWGLLNMRERAEAIGGRCLIVAWPGAGVSVLVEVKR